MSQVLPVDTVCHRLRDTGRPTSLVLKKPLNGQPLGVKLLENRESLPTDAVFLCLIALFLYLIIPLSFN